jgi:hypothetical protein
MCWLQSDYTATRPRCRCWPRIRPLPADYGPMCATTGRSAVRRRRQRSSTTRATAPASIRAAISRPTPASCKPTPMPGSTSSTTPHANLVRSLRLGVGATDGASCSCWPMSPRRRWRSRRCAGLMQSSISSATSTDCRQTSARRCARSGPRLWLPVWRPGCAANVADCLGMPMSRRRWTTCSSAGMCLRAS